jgi:hypothetical protein
MDYVNNFLSQAASEEWDHDYIIQAWNENEKDIKALVDVIQPIKKEPIKKESSPKDPNKPKKGRSAYIYFCSEAREEIKADLGDVKPHEVMKELGVRWRTLKESSDETDKNNMAKFVKMSSDDKARASEEMETYVPPSEEELAAIDKPKRGRKTKKKSGKPIKSRSAYIYFCGSVRESVKEENPDMIGSEITKILSELWKIAKEENGEEFQTCKEMSDKDKIRYAEEMETYPSNE